MQWLMPRVSVSIAPFFHLTYLENTGAAFGLMHGDNAALIVVSVLLLAGLAYMSWRWPSDHVSAHYGIVLVGGGALGNLYDRVFYGYVVDFLDFRVWPVFNVADSCICVGAGLLAWSLHCRKN